MVTWQNYGGGSSDEHKNYLGSPDDERTTMTGTNAVQDLRDAVRYRERELLNLVGSLVLFAVAVVYITTRWDEAWPKSVTQSAFVAIEAALPVGPESVYGFPLFVLLGLASLFLFDGYKRLQGLLLAAGAVALFLTATAIGRLQWDWLALPTLVSLIAGLSVGLLAGGIRSARSQEGRNRFERGFTLLRVAVVGIGLLMIVEQQYDPFLTGGPVPGSAFAELAVDIGAVVVLAVTLADLTEYEAHNDVVILGPSRAGKTWLMAGLAYTFNEPDVDAVVETDTELSDRMNRLYNQYETGNFENIGPTGTNTAVPMELETDIGGLFGGRLRVRSVDYSGETLADLDLESEVSDGLRTRVSEFYEEDTEWGNLQGQLSGDSYEIEELLAALVADADVVCLTLPMDAVLDADEWSDGDLTTPLTTDDLRVTHDPPKRTTAEGERGYYDVYDDVRSARDDGVVFLGTKADLLVQAYGDDARRETLNRVYGEGEGPTCEANPGTNWSDFRTFAWTFAAEKHTNIDFRPGGSQEDFFPVYFETESERTDNKDLIKPVQGREEGNELTERSPLRGLRHLFRRLR